MNQRETTNQTVKIQYPEIDLRAFFYLLAISLYMIYFILCVSFYQNYVGSFYEMTVKFSFVLLVIAELTDFHYTFSDWLGIAFIAAVMLSTFYLLGDVWARPFLWILLFAFGARHIDFKKIARWALILSTVLFLFVILSSAAGKIPDYLDTVTHPGVTRHYLGFLYCLFPPTVLFNIEALYYYLRKDRLHWWEFVLGLALAYLFYKLCDARLNFILNALMIVGIFVVRYRQKWPKAIKKVFSRISAVLPWLFVICAAISIVFSFGYNSNLSWMAKINHALGNRLGMGRLSYHKYGVNAFGQIIVMLGNGLSGNGIRGRGHYFYLDCLYVRFLQEYGLVFSILMMIIMTVSAYRMWRRKKYSLLVILSVLALHAIVDDLILMPYYNTFWVVLIYFIGKKKTQKKGETEMKVCLVGSSGGHLTHLYMLKPFWQNKERFWVTFDKEDARSLLKDEKMYPCYYPTNRSIKAFFINLRVAWKVLRKEKPDLIISSGAAVAVPFFYLGKMMGMKTIYIEVFDRVDKPTLTGKLVYPITDKFIVEWEEMKKIYPKAINLGSIF
jgi:beta-1,4-N-acetylglucosaminyltransferase